MPGPSGQLRGVVRDGLRPPLAARLLAPLHHDESCVWHGRRSTLGPLGVCIRSRPPRDELGRKGDLPAGRAAYLPPALRSAPRGRGPGSRRLRGPDPQRARQRDVGPAVGVARATVSLPAPALAGTLVGCEHWSAAGAQRFRHGRVERPRTPPRRCARRTAAHMGFGSRSCVYFVFSIRRPSRSTLFPYPTLFEYAAARYWVN